MKNNYTIIGGFVGFSVGIALTFLYPWILRTGVQYNTQFTQDMNYSSYVYNGKETGFYTALIIVPFACSLLGILMGLAFQKSKEFSNTGNKRSNTTSE